MARTSFDRTDVFFDKTAIVENGALVGAGTKVWHHAHVRAGATIGRDCVIGKNVYVDSNVIIGDRVKIQNNVSLYNGLTVENEAFIGPHVTFTNDLYPRSRGSWEIVKTCVEFNASVGANATIKCGVTVGRSAMIGCGSVVTDNVIPHGLVRGNPARLVGFVCKCGLPMTEARPHSYVCSCGSTLRISMTFRGRA
jgi:UDP-2-acetamido-3-amino-2,3-dideoxy-glucuronate N-acetyltransferase